MKKVYKILIGTFVFVFGLLFGGIISFCSAENVSDKITWLAEDLTVDFNFAAGNYHYKSIYDTSNNYGTYCFYFSNIHLDYYSAQNSLTMGFGAAPTTVPMSKLTVYNNQSGHYYCIYGNKRYFNIGNIVVGSTSNTYQSISGFVTFSVFKLDSLLSESIITSCPSSSINVLYNNENSTETVICNGDNIIQIDGLSTITSTNKWTPYFNINYHDEDNQLLTESYSNDILYLSGGLFKKTYIGDNDWILTVQGLNSSNSFSGYLPTFEITGGIENVSSGNIFNNFAENSVKFTLSNIPSYIQYVIIIFILFFILGFIRKFKR